MFGNQDLLAQQHRMHRTRAAIRVVDVERVDPHQHSAGIPQPDCRLFGEVRMAFEIGVGAPVRVPSGVHQYGLAAHAERRDLRRQCLHIDFPTITRRRAQHDRGLINEPLERHRRRVASVGVAMERTVDVRPGVGDQLHPPDLKLGTRFIQSTRVFATQVVADHRRWQTLVIHHAMFNRVAEVYQRVRGRRHAAFRNRWRRRKRYGRPSCPTDPSCSRRRLRESRTTHRRHRAVDSHHVVTRPVSTFSRRRCYRHRP